MKKKIIDISTATERFKKMSRGMKTDECILVANPSYIYQPFDVYTLSPVIKKPLPRLLAIVKDMDGTTTTTEPLCLHSLEFMVRRISDRMGREKWKGLDRDRDYPHVIGNSTTRHVEYLLKAYARDIKRDAFLVSYIDSALWTLTVGKDESRKNEVRKNIVALGIGGVLEEPRVRKFISGSRYVQRQATEISSVLSKKYRSRFTLDDFHDEVRAGVDIYYQRYHYILGRIALGEGALLAREVGLPEGRHLVEPMPGVAVFLAAVRGWLGDALELFYDEFVDYLVNHPRTNYTPQDFEGRKAELRTLGLYLQVHPVKVAIVTSSILYEANIVLNEVFSILCEQVKEWKIDTGKKEFILKRFASYADYYDSVITASDSSEIRLKPHRDLYSMALYQLGITQDEFKYCIGFEDSESGTVAIRAAGIGLCIAVPFADTEGHDLSAASHILPGGIPETLLRYGLFIKQKR